MGTDFFKKTSQNPKFEYFSGSFLKKLASFALKVTGFAPTIPNHLPATVLAFLQRFCNVLRRPQPFFQNEKINL